MSTQASLLYKVYTLFTADTTLKALMGGTVRLTPVWATKAVDFPYGVHKINNVANAFQGLYNGSYDIDVWDFESNPKNLYAIRDSIIRILDWIRIDDIQDPDTGKIDIKCARFIFATDEIFAEDTENTWHLTIRFNVRYDKFREIVNILNR